MTGNVTDIRKGLKVGTRAIKCNSAGHNVADNFIYACTFSTSGNGELIRISGAGDCATLGTIEISNPTCGDVDENSQYWAAVDGKAFVQYDLRPGSANYSKLISKGTAAPDLYVIDWAYVPDKGNNLWGLGTEPGTSVRATTSVVKFNGATKVWTTVKKFGDIAGLTGGAANSRNTWGAIYATDDGFLYGSENNSGEIWRFPVPENGVGEPVGVPIKFSIGPPSAWGNDGARCINAASL